MSRQHVLGCAQEKIAVVIDPEIDKADDYVDLVDFFGAKLQYAIDTTLMPITTRVQGQA